MSVLRLWATQRPSAPASARHRSPDSAVTARAVHRFAPLVTSLKLAVRMGDSPPRNQAGVPRSNCRALSCTRMVKRKKRGETVTETAAGEQESSRVGTTQTGRRMFRAPRKPDESRAWRRESSTRLISLDRATRFRAVRRAVPRPARRPRARRRRPVPRISRVRTECVRS
jgi:hypothetical protein